MGCQKCGSTRIVRAGGKVSDMFGARIGEHDHEGYVPRDLGIGSGDYMELDYCADCGQIQGEFPLPPTEMETSGGDEEE